MKLITIVVLITLSFFHDISAQEFDDSIEVYLIDSFVTPEKPNTFILSFFTSAPARSKVIINGEYEYVISAELTEDHKLRLDVAELEFNKKLVPYIIYLEDSSGAASTSEKYEFDLPQEIEVRTESNFLLLCLFGGAVFILPSPVYVNTSAGEYFSLTKELPLLTFRGDGIKYPMSYLSAEYSHIFNAPAKNFFRLGYKHIIEIPVLEYIAPGVNGFTNFKGYNGISPELSIGLLRLFNTFTLYGRYRYNFQPGRAESEFHEISAGLYTSFFTLYL